MKKEEVIDWLMIMKANLNSFPEVSNAKKIEALAEAIRLLKNEQSIDKIDCDHTECRNCINHKYCDYEISSSEIPNKSIEEKCPCYDCEYFVIDGLSHCKIYEGAYGDCRCKNYHKANQDSNKVNQDSNKSESPTGSDDCISREQAKAAIRDKFKDLPSRVEINTILNELPSANTQEPRWIPVSERLPKKEGDYLVTVRNKEYGFQYIDITTYEHGEWGYKDEWQVIAWMNAPSEYKGESEEE